MVNDLSKNRFTHSSAIIEEKQMQLNDATRNQYAQTTPQGYFTTKEEEEEE